MTANNATGNISSLPGRLEETTAASKFLRVFFDVSNSISFQKKNIFFFHNQKQNINEYHIGLLFQQAGCGISRQVLFALSIFYSFLQLNGLMCL